jgi:hypothetical protein
LQRLRKVLRKTGKGSTALQTIERNSQIATANSQGALLPKEPVESRLDSVAKSQLNATSRAFLIPKISLASLTALLTSVFLFPKTFMDHPFVGQMLKGPHAVGIWLAAIALLSCSWLSVWWLEQRKRWHTDQMLSLHYQKQALDLAARVGSGCFSASDYRDKLWSRYRPYPNWFRKLVGKLRRQNIYFYTSPLYDAQLVEKAAELALERFVQKGWIVRAERPEDEKDTDDWYRIV